MATEVPFGQWLEGRRNQFLFFLIGERAKSVDAPDAPDTRAKTSTSVERRRGLRAGRESEGVTFRHKRARCERSEPCVITVLAPSRLKQVCTYSMRAKCLREFQEIYRKAHDRKDPEHNSARKLYQFYLDIAPEALLLYDRWKSHQGFAGTGIRSITRDKREILPGMAKLADAGIRPMRVPSRYQVYQLATLFKAPLSVIMRANAR